MYNKFFFGSAKTEDGYVKRLGAVVQSLLTEFAESMRLEGEARRIVDVEENSQELGPNAISRREYVEEVKHLTRKSRGCELPGTFNPLIVGELFAEQCQPWRDQVARAKDRIFEAARSTMVAIIDYVAVEETADGLIHSIGLRMEALKQDLDRRLDGLLQPHFEIHPITYNHYLTENVQKAQSARRRRKLETVLRTTFANLKDPIYNGLSPLHLLNLLDDSNEADMETHASNLAVDYMQAYYKVALKRFIDDFSVLGIEQCLIQKMSSLFTPEVLQAMTTKDIAAIVAESPETGAERRQCNERLAVLEAGLQNLKVLDRHRPGSANDGSQDIEECLENGTQEELAPDMPYPISASPSTLHETVLEEAEEGFSIMASPVKKMKKGKKKYSDDQSSA
ncbi:hypothetical protein LTR86_010423 [Recurvomyces mirabilis]|nr:hypothetical protein LTR86_010423 [Recurvomyces mirabilis]